MRKHVKPVIFILIFALVMTIAPVFSAQATEDLPVITILANSNGAGVNRLNDSRTQQAMFEAIGVKPFYEQVDNEVFTLRVHSGDVPDMVSLGGGTGEFHTALIEAGTLISLDELIPQYAPSLYDTMGTSLKLSKEYWSLGKDQTFLVPLGVGPGWQEYYWYLRWDYFKEIGAPDITDVDTFVDALCAMAEAHPTASNGQPTYAIGTFADWGLGYTFTCPLYLSLGNVHIGGHTYYNLGDTDTIMSYLDDNEKSSYFQTCEFYNKIYRRGFFDPDSLSQGYADFGIKRNAGQYVFAIASWSLGEFYLNFGDQGAAMVTVPWKGGEFYGHGNQQKYVGFTFGITKNCQDVESAMKFINYVCSYEGLATLYNGVEGVDWIRTEDDKIELTESFIADVKQGSLRERTGIGYDTNYMGFTNLTVDPALNMPIYWLNDPVLAALTINPVEEDFSTHYGAASPLEVWSNAVANGDMKDYRNEDTLAWSLMPPLDPTLAKIQANIDTLLGTYGARLVTAESEEEYAAVKQEALAEFAAAGRDELLEWYAAQWAEARAKATELR
jgi:multiple sugar transport system substrate-binding protein